MDEADSERGVPAFAAHRARDAMSPAARGRPSGDRGWTELCVALSVRALVRPRLALDLLATVWAFRAREWYRRSPFLPLPPRDYIEWRMYTAYGSADTVPPLEDVIRFARWRRQVIRP